MTKLMIISLLREEVLTFWMFLEKELVDLISGFELLFDFPLINDSEDYWEWIKSKNNEINVCRPHDYEIGRGLYGKPIEIRIKIDVSKDVVEFIGNQLVKTFQTDIYQGNIHYHNHKEFSLNQKRIFRK
jgi:hypothetical protein